MITENQIEHLKNFSLFKDIAESDEKMAIVSKYMTPQRAKKDEYLFREGDEGDEIFILMKGKVRVIKKTKQQEEYTIVDLEDSFHVFFGEMALMDQDVRSASIMILEDSELLVMNREGFMEMGDQHPEIGLPITRVVNKIVIDRLRNVNNDVILLFGALVDEIQTNHL
ncbi:MAG: cyclic nucleotide-binding domain-containing protein [SAR324 cluster bacterium]|nr:cyclic nucleotide-binding domain-containing protein [SAR324 cluster bacterium]